MAMICSPTNCLYPALDPGLQSCSVLQPILRAKSTEVVHLDKVMERVGAWVGFQRAPRGPPADLRCWVESTTGPDFEQPRDQQTLDHDHPPTFNSVDPSVDIAVDGHIEGAPTRYYQHVRYFETSPPVYSLRYVGRMTSLRHSNVKQRNTRTPLARCSTATFNRRYRRKRDCEQR